MISFYKKKQLTTLEITLSYLIGSYQTKGVNKTQDKPKLYGFYQAKGMNKS